MKLLSTDNLTKTFGGLVAVNRLNLSIEEGEILGLVGPNGAGKTTVFNLICGDIPATEGKIVFKDRDISSLKPYQVAAKGIIRTFQLTTVFNEFTVLENVIMAFHLRARAGFLSELLKTPRSRRRTKEVAAASEKVLESVALVSKKDELAGNLSYGQQKTLALAMALAPEPELLLVDEPLTGLSLTEIPEILKLLREIRSRGVTILMIEHNVKAAFTIFDRVIAIDHGEIIAEGTPDEVRQNEEVVRAYLGK